MTRKYAQIAAGCLRVRYRAVRDAGGLNDSVTKRIGFSAGRNDVAKIIRLPGNFIGPADREKLESFGGHTIAHGRATRWRWDKTAAGDDVFEIHTGGAADVLAVSIGRDRKLDQYIAYDAAGNMEYLAAEGYDDFIYSEMQEFLDSAPRKDMAGTKISFFMN